MLPISDIRILLLIFSLLTSTKSKKLLSDQKKCGDPECETSMSRVLAIKDYTGPDCRYLNFKTGEEIMVYFKLSRKREDLWAGSKGTEFGYFPMDAVQIEDIFITKEVEVPTKETDFLCLDGEEYVFENEDSILNHNDKENEYIPLYSNEEESEFKMSEDEVLTRAGISSPKEYEETSSENYEFDNKSKELHTQETTSHGDSELRNSKTRQDETIQQGDQVSQTLKVVPTQSTWTMSGFADWLGLGSKENEEAVRKLSQTTEEITFSRRKIAITDDSDLKTLHEEGETEPRSASWFKSTFTDLLPFGSEKSGLDLLYKENDPEIHDSSTIAGNAGSSGPHGSSIASETRKEEHSNSDQSKSSWFYLELSDVLPFSYAKENIAKQMFAGGEAADQNEEQPPPSAQSSLTDEGLRKEAVKLMPYEEQDKEKCVQEDLGIDVKKKHSEMQLAKEHTDFKDAAASFFSTEHIDNLLYPYPEQDSISDSQVMENIKAITKESERTNEPKSGWYESVYSSLIDFNKVISDNQPGHESVAVESPHESVVDQFPSSYSIREGLDPIDVLTAREDNHEGPEKKESFFSISYFTNVLNVQGFISKGNKNIQHAHKNLKSIERTQSKKGEEILHVVKESKEQLQENQNVIEKVSENRDDTSQGNILLSSLAAKSNEKSRDKTQDGKLAKDNAPHAPSVKSELEHRVSHTENMKFGKPEDHSYDSLETQSHTNIEHKNDVHILETKQLSSLQLQNLADSEKQHNYISEDACSCEKSAVIKEDLHDGKAVSLDKTDQVKNSFLQASESYLERISTGKTISRMEDEDEDESSLVMHENILFKELKEHSDNFSQSKSIPGADEILLDVSDEDRSVTLEGREQSLSEKFHVMESNEMKEMTKKSGGNNYQADFNKCFSSDTEDVKTNILNNKKEEEAISQNAENTAQFSCSSSSSQVRDLVDATNLEGKPSRLEEPQSIFSFSHYKHLLSFQSSAAKNNNYMSSKDENSHSKSSIELLPKNKKEKKQSYQEKKKELFVLEDFPHKYILLSSLAKHDNGGSGNVIKDALLLQYTSPASFEEYLSKHIIDSLFSNQNVKEKITEDSEEFTNTKDSKPFLSQHVVPELKYSVQRSSQQYKTIKKDSRCSKHRVNENNFLVSKVLDGSSHTPVVDYADVMKRVQVADPLSSFHSEKHTSNNVQENVMDLYDEKELADVKNIESVSPKAIKYYFPINSSAKDELNKSVVTMEGKYQFSQRRAKERMHFSLHISELTEGERGHDEQSILNNQELSQEMFQSEKISGHTSQILSYDFDTYRVQMKDFNDPQVQIGEKSVEEEHSSKPTEKHIDNAQVSDSSLIVKFIYGHDQQEQIMLPYPSSDTFSKKSMHLPQIPVSLTHQTEDREELKGEQVSSSHHDCKSSNIMSLGPDEKCINQNVHDMKNYLTADLEVEKIRISAQLKQMDGTENTEESRSEYQQQIADITPKLSGMKSGLVTTGVLQKQHGIVETSSVRENPTLHLEVQSETSDITHNTKPSKHFSHDIPHHHEPLDHHIDPIHPHAKDALDTHYLAIEIDGETFAQDVAYLFPKNLNHVEKIAYSGYVRDSQEKGKTDMGGKKKLKHNSIDCRNDKTGESGVVIFLGKHHGLLVSNFKISNLKTLKKIKTVKILLMLILRQRGRRLA